MVRKPARLPMTDVRELEHTTVRGHPRGSRLVGKAFLVSHKPETPFDSIEGSHEYVALLAEALAEARCDIESEVAAAESEGADRRKQALLLVSYNLAKLNLHITASRRILNDLRTLRRLLLAEPRPAALPDQDQVTAPDPG